MAELTEIELAQKMKSGEATAKEVIDYAMADPDISKSRKKHINRLYTGFNKLGLDINMPYKDLKNKEVARLFTKDGSPDKANRATPIQSLEKGLENSIFNKYGLRAVSENVGDGIEIAMYPVLTGEGSLIGTQRTGGVGERPMRGLITMEDYTKIYAEGLPKIEKDFGQPTADLIEYHAFTANRPSQLLDLKKSQVTIGNGKITVAGKPKTTTNTKGRPTLTFDLDSPTGQLLERNYNSSKSDKLFDVTEVDFENAFNKHIGTRLEAFSDKLPLADVKLYEADGITVKEIVQKPVTSLSAVRSIVPKIMLDQYNIPDGLVQGIMGHANNTILRRNYAGIAPETDLPKILESPSSFSVGMFGTNKTNINLDLLTDEDKEEIRKEQKETLLQESKARQATAATQEVKAKTSVSEADILQAAEVDRALIRAAEQKRLEEAQIRKQVRAEFNQEPTAADAPNPHADGVDMRTMDSSTRSKMLEFLEKAGKYVPGPVKKALGPLGIGLSAVAAESTTKEVEAATGSRTLAAMAGASEFAPITYSDLKSLAEARAYPDFHSLTPAGRIAAEEEAGFIDLGRNRGPEAAPVSQEQGFASRNNGR